MKSLLSLLAVLCTACAGGGDYEIQLKYGYFIARTSPGEIGVVDPSQRVVILPTVDGYRVQGDVLIGHVRSEDGSSYFLIDMKARRVVQKLTEAEWRREGGRLGIRDYSLRRPSRYASWLG